MNYPEMNRIAWEIATLAMVRRKEGVGPYSTTQIRKFLALAQVPDAELSTVIDVAIRDYQPRPALQFGGTTATQEEDLKMREVKNACIGEKLKGAFAMMDVPSRTRFMQYLIWDIKIIEQAFRTYGSDPRPFLQKLFDVEGLEKTDSLIENILPLMAGRGGDRDYNLTRNERVSRRGKR